MAATIGPLFSIEVEVPETWNLAGTLAPMELAVKDSTGRGYVVEVFHQKFRERLRQSQSFERIFIAQILREDAEIYYGFQSPLERALFTELRELDGVGPKTAAQMLSLLEVEGLYSLLAEGSVIKITGLGPKTMEKLQQGLKQRKEKFMAIFQSWKNLTQEAPPLRNLPDLLVRSLERLGMNGTSVRQIFLELSDEDPHFEKLESSEVLQKILKRWGLRRPQPKNMGSKNV